MALWGSSRRPDLQSRIDDIQSSLASLGDLIGEIGHATTRGARSARDTAADTAGEASSAIAPVLSNLRGQIDSLFSTAGSTTTGLARRAGSGGKHAYRAVEEKVEGNAMLAVLAAAGVGVLIGALLPKASPGQLQRLQQQPQRRAAARSVSRSAKGRRRAA